MKNEQYDKKDIVLGTAGIVGSKNLILGKKRMYHGTSKANWESIKDNGLLASKGGGDLGSSAIKGVISEESAREYRKNSKNMVHATRLKPVANMYANLRDGVGGHEFKGNPLKMFVSPARSGDGKVLKINMDYDKFKKMSIDNAGSVGDDIPKAFKPLAKNMAAKGNINITPEEIKGTNTTLSKRIRHTMQNMPGYIKNNPLRFTAGLGAAIGGGALIHHALNKNKEASIYYDLIEKLASNDLDISQTIV